MDVCTARGEVLTVTCDGSRSIEKDAGVQHELSSFFSTLLMCEAKGATKKQRAPIAI